MYKNNQNQIIRKRRSYTHIIVNFDDEDDDDDDDDDNLPTYSDLLINSSTASPRNSSLSLCRILQTIEKIPKERHKLMLCRGEKVTLLNDQIHKAIIHEVQCDHRNKTVTKSTSKPFNNLLPVDARGVGRNGILGMRYTFTWNPCAFVSCYHSGLVLQEKNASLKLNQRRKRYVSNETVEQCRRANEPLSLLSN